MKQCPMCKQEGLDEEHNYCIVCGHKFEKQKIAEIIKDKEGVTAEILSDNVKIRDILMGMAIMATGIVKQSGKNIDEVLEYVKKIYENCKIEKEK
ncbi:MAG: hypothetical protein HFJ30_07110 [Clostridia bacterium]|jgi:hypothetical protein|nr:hypothetical protein [Clostridia bacterium]